jgi:hypothetical protein
MQPGTTVVVTNARVRSGSSERRLVVLASGK